MKTLSFIVLSVMTLTAGAQDLTGPQIINQVNDILTPESSVSTSEMTITTSSGQQRTFVMKSWSKNKGELNLVRYLEPRRVKDQATLMRNHADDIWMYFPRTQRVRKLASHAKKQKIQGSDFSYEDMGSGDAFITDFKAERLQDESMNGYDCFKVELTRKPDSDMGYSRLIMWIIKENFYPIVIDYYDEEYPDRKLKRLTQSDIRVIDGIPTAMQAVMTHANDNTQTVMQITEVEYNVNLDDSMFTERGLKQ